MFLEEAAWIRRALAEIPVGPETRILDVGSSTIDFRTRVQPHIEAEVYAPLRARGGRITAMDRKPEDGVDLVLDIEKEDSAGVPDFAIVIAANLLEHVRDRSAVLRQLGRFVRPGGHLLITAPRRYRIHHDPIDTGFRPTLRRLEAEARMAGLDLRIRKATIVRIEEARYYRTESSWSEWLRYRARLFTWAQTCLLMQLPSSPEMNNARVMPNTASHA